MQTKKITLATIKSFIKKNEAALYINTKSSFSGMTDCVESLRGGFVLVPFFDSMAKHPEYNLGIEGAWFVGSSRDYFTAYDENGFTGYSISNYCGHFILAVKS